MDKIYICSPLRGDIEKNMQRARNYCRYVLLKETVIPVCPHIYFTQFLDDNKEIERKLGTDLGKALLTDCKEIWVFDENGISQGMKEEIEIAERLNIPVIYQSNLEKSEI